MARDYNFWVYIITNRNQSVLYIGVTNRLSAGLTSTAYCVREKLPNTTRLIFMPEPYPCYPFNPRHGEQAVVLLRL